jgi:hypothetical protein
LEPAKRGARLVRTAAFHQSWLEWFWWRAELPDHGSYVRRILGDGGRGSGCLGALHEQRVHRGGFVGIFLGGARLYGWRRRRTRTLTGLAVLPDRPVTAAGTHPDEFRNFA